MRNQRQTLVLITAVIHGSGRSVGGAASYQFLLCNEN